MDQSGGEKKSKKTKKTIKTTKDSTKPKTKKPAAKKTTKTTKTRSKAKGGNFLGSVGDLVAPTGWGPFATAAGLLAVNRVSAALRKGTKKEKMRGGYLVNCNGRPVSSRVALPVRFSITSNKNMHSNSYLKTLVGFSFSDKMTIYIIEESQNQYYLKIEANFIKDDTETPKAFSICDIEGTYSSIENAKEAANFPDTQLRLGNSILKEYAKTQNIRMNQKFILPKKINNSNS
jgi:flagellar biogenesis protein FliO